MIISHRHRFIFVAVPKTGTQSIRAALRPHLGPEDWEQEDWDGSRRFPLPDMAALGHGHLGVDDVRPKLAPGLWEAYFTFAFVRNPWTRFVSCAFFRNRHRPLFRSRPRGVMKLLLESGAVRDDILFKPQHGFVESAAGDARVAFVGRYERLQEGFDTVCDRVGLPRSVLPHLNDTEHAPPGDYYDDELQESVGRYYERDIRTFGYAFDGGHASRPSVSGHGGRAPGRGGEFPQDGWGP